VAGRAEGGLQTALRVRRARRLRGRRESRAEGAGRPSRRLRGRVGSHRVPSADDHGPRHASCGQAHDMNDPPRLDDASGPFRTSDSDSSQISRGGRFGRLARESRNGLRRGGQLRRGRHCLSRRSHRGLRCRGRGRNRGPGRRRLRGLGSGRHSLSGSGRRRCRLRDRGRVRWKIRGRRCRRGGHGSAWQKAQWIDVAVGITRQANAEVQIRLGPLRVARAAERAQGIAFLDRRVSSDGERTEVDQRD